MMQIKQKSAPSLAGSTVMRYVIAVALGFAAVFLYLRFTAKPPATSQPAATQPAVSNDAGAGQADSRPSTAPTAVLTKPLGPPTRVEIHNDRLYVTASNRGGRLISIRLLGYGLFVDTKEEEKNDPKRCLELVHHSDAPVSAFSLFLQPEPYAEPGHPIRPLLGVLEQSDWEISKLGAEGEKGEGVQWKLSAGPFEFTKTFRLQKTGYVGEFTIDVRVRDAALESSRDASSSLQLYLLPAGWVFSDNDRFSLSQSAAVGRQAAGRSPIVELHSADAAQKIQADSFNPVWSEMPGLAPPAEGQAPERFIFFADANKYFVAAILPKDNTTKESLISAKALGIHVANAENRIESRAASVALLKSKLPKLDKPVHFEFTTYFGPKEYDALAAVPDLREIHNKDRSSFMSFGWLSDGIAAMLRIFHGIFGNWGLSIIVLTICLRAAMFPLTRRSQVVLAEFGAKQAMIKPKLEALTQQYKDNPKKLNEERIKLFKANNVPIAPPVGGCLPIFLNIPVFVGFFSALRTMYELRHQPFGLWIHDLSRPDEVIHFANSFRIPIPLIGDMIGEIRGLNILPLFMIAMWIANQWVTQKNMPQSNDPQQKFTQRFTMGLTVVMGSSLYNYASGLSVYSITSSTVTLLEQTLIRKFWPPKTVVPPAKK